MSDLKKKKKTKSRNFKKEIFSYLKNSPFGSTITDIARNIESTRITVSKYILALETEGKVFSQIVGVYKLYFSAERTFFPKDTILSYYIGLLSGFSREVANHNKFKEIGKLIASFMDFPFISQIPKSIIPSRGINYNDFLQYFRILYHNIDFLHDKTNFPKVKRITEKSAVYHFRKLDLLAKSEIYKLHYYIMSGLVEIVISKFLKRTVVCRIDKIDLGRKEVDLSINIQ